MVSLSLRHNAPYPREPLPKSVVLPGTGSSAWRTLPSLLPTPTEHLSVDADDGRAEDDDDDDELYPQYLPPPAKRSMRSKKRKPPVRRRPWPWRAPVCIPSPQLASNPRKRHALPDLPSEDELYPQYLPPPAKRRMRSKKKKKKRR